MKGGAFPVPKDFSQVKDVARSRREELLLEEGTLKMVWTMRRMLSAVGTNEGIELLMNRMAKTENNAQFLASIPMNRDLYDIQNSIPGSVAEGIEYRRMSVYDVAALQERFDIVFFIGVLYHLRHPLLALDLIHEHVARDLLVFQALQISYGRPEDG